jgi:hypothetical protein
MLRSVLNSTRGSRRRLTRFLVLSLTLVALPASVPAVAVAVDQPKVSGGGTICQGNTIYTVCVDDIGQIGRYTARTGPAHPVPNRNVLFGGEGSAPGTSFNSYRSFTSGTTYTQGLAVGGVNMNAFAPTTTTIGTTGVRTTWQITGVDNLRIVQDVNVNGTTFNDSNIEVTTTITNTGTESRALGIRYLWDYQIGLDDGPTFQERNPDGPVRIHEAEFRPVVFEYYEIEDNDFADPTSPIYTVLGTALGPGNVTPAPTAPTQITYGCWQDAVSTAFDYSIVPGRDVATMASPCGGGRGGDNTTIYWWGRDADSARTLAPDQSVTERALLFATLPDQPPPFACALTLSPSSATNPVLTPHPVTATVTCNEEPQAGVVVTFTVTGTGSTPTPPGGTCTTGPDGTCTFTYTSPTPGDDVIRANATVQGGQVLSGMATKTWTAVTPPPCPPEDDDDDDGHEDDDDNDGLTNVNENLLLTLVGIRDSDFDGVVDGNDDSNGNGEDDEDEDDDDECPDEDEDDDGVDDEDEDDDDDDDDDD